MRAKKNGDKTDLRWNGCSHIIIFLTQASVIFIQENAAFIQVLIYQAWYNQLFNTDKQITGSFLRTLILCKPLVFICKTLKKYVKNSLKYHTFIKTYFNYVFIQIKWLISDFCALLVLCTLIRPSSDADLFLSRTWYLELSTRKVQRLNQLRTPIWIWNSSAILPAWLSQEFCLWSGCDSHAEPFMCQT